MTGHWLCLDNTGLDANWAFSSAVLLVLARLHLLTFNGEWVCAPPGEFSVVHSECPQHQQAVIHQGVGHDSRRLAAAGEAGIQAGIQAHRFDVYRDKGQVLFTGVNLYLIQLGYNESCAKKSLKDDLYGSIYREHDQ